MADYIRTHLGDMARDAGFVDLLLLVLAPVLLGDLEAALANLAAHPIRTPILNHA